MVLWFYLDIYTRMKLLGKLIDELIAEAHDPDTDPAWRNWMGSVGLPLPVPLNMPEPEDDGEEIGSTNVPHGTGYPNVSKKPRDIFHIYYIVDDDADEATKRDKHLNIDTIRVLYKKFPEFVRKWKESLKHLYSDRVSYHMRYYHQDKMTPEDKQAVSYAEKVERFLADQRYYQSDATNPRNYPLFVSAYDVTREYGGGEEGGWYYTAHNLLKSIRTNSPEETRKAAAQLYKVAKFGDLDGQLRIYVERKKGSQQLKERPTYS